MLTVRDIMKYGVRDHMGARVELEELATKALVYTVAEGFTIDDLNQEVPPPSSPAYGTGLFKCCLFPRPACGGVVGSYVFSMSV